MYLVLDMRLCYNTVTLGGEAIIKKCPLQIGGFKMAEKTPAQKKAQAAYMEKFNRIALRVDPALHHADRHGQSVNGYIIEAVAEKMERE